jgi:hypothetical protein
MDAHRISRQPQPIACTLSASEAVDRGGDWRAAVDQAEGWEQTATGVSLRFPRDPELAARLADLAAREADCCAFFTFQLAVANDGLRFDIAAPPDGQGVLLALFAEPDRA